MKKMLMVATVPSMIGQFNMSNIRILQEMGYTVHVACDFNDTSVWNDYRIAEFKNCLRDMNIKWWQIDFSRSPLKLHRHINSYKQLKEVVIQEDFDFIHCHTPIAAAITRVVCKQTHKKCIYTAHGFHFYKGAPLKNWIIYYPIEKILSRWTDVLVTITTEDYDLAKKKFNAKKVYYVPGVGYDKKKICVNNEKHLIRKEFNFPNDAIILLTVGELNDNKNQILVIKVLEQIKNKNVFYLLCGQGENDRKLKEYVSNHGLENNVRFLGYRNDLAQIYGMADIYLCPSYREGLNVSIMEAMANGLPCIVSDIRGNRDLVDENGGYLVNGFDISIWKKYICKTMQRKFDNYNQKKIELFSFEVVNEKMSNLYRHMS